MYAYFKGTLIKLEIDHVILDVLGIGYLIHTPLSLFTQCIKEGSSLFLYTSYIVREDSQRLFGFQTLEDKQMFEKLLKISGLGPKTALSIVGQSDTMNLEEIIKSKDSLSLTKIPGIGKKTAERIITELSDQMGSNTTKTASLFSNDAIAALVTLGYKERQAYDLVQKALKKSTQKLNLSNLISLSLEK
ncbi:MAG: Holliday junction ATP-dependent DNA helicase RuvA [Chlamydiia bacterium]|nr:Holliday junction ATP-dependent DNA helicase RuvA [Chlamydiia bacterium]